MEINGKEVRFKASLPASFIWELIPVLQAVKQGDNIIAKIPWETAVKMIQGSVESWEYDADPLDDDWYNSLSAGDVMDVFTPLLLATYTHLVGLVTATNEEVPK